MCATAMAGRGTTGGKAGRRGKGEEGTSHSHHMAKEKGRRASMAKKEGNSVGKRYRGRGRGLSAWVG